MNSPPCDVICHIYTAGNQLGFKLQYLTQYTDLIRSQVESRVKMHVMNHITMYTACIYDPVRGGHFHRLKQGAPDSYILPYGTLQIKVQFDYDKLESVFAK